MRMSPRQPLEKMEEDTLPRARRSRRRIYIIGAVLIIVAIAVGLGVGLGLGLRNNGDDDDSDSDGSSGGGMGLPAVPTPVTERTFWQPAVDTSWQIILLNPLDLDADATTTEPNVEAFDLDLFTNDQSTFTKLRSLSKKVICYFSAGSYESNRPDSGLFKAEDKGKELDGWPGEYWLQTNSENVRTIMSNRIKFASDKGCDAIDPDNVDGFQNDNGFDLKSDDTVNFMQFMSEEAAKYNMSIGLKNAGSIIDDVLSFTHFSVNEQCAEFSECATFAPFVQAGKPVFHIEYPSDAPTVSSEAVAKVCGDSGSAEGSDEFRTVIKKMNLDGWVEYCDGSTANSATKTVSSSS